MNMPSEEQEFVIAKFKRYGHQIGKKTLQRAIQWLQQRPNNSLDELLKKMSQLALDSRSTQESMQHAIQILFGNNRSLSSYDDLLQQTRKRCIYPISPYQIDVKTWFAQRPSKDLFEFIPQDRLRQNIHYFKRISEVIKDLPKGSMFGVIYENYSSLTSEGRPKLMIQNQVNQVEINLVSGLVPKPLIIAGCAYITRGYSQGRNLQYTVQSFDLPPSIPQPKNSLIKQKFRQMCENISAAKQKPGFTPIDFIKYDCIYTPVNEHLKPTLIYGNIRINIKTMERLSRLVAAYTQGVSAIILLLSGEEHEPIDVSIWLKCKVYLVPHLTSEGPRILPKLPLLKNRIPHAKVLTNPARICIQGKQIILVNYPLIRNIYNNCMLQDRNQTRQEKQERYQKGQEMVAKVSQLIFSQSSVGLTQNIYWKQSQYFYINCDTTVIAYDSVAAMGFHKSKGKGGFATTGNFERDGDFLCFMSKAKTFIQFCEQPQQ